MNCKLLNVALEVYKNVCNGTNLTPEFLYTISTCHFFGDGKEGNGQCIDHFTRNVHIKLYLGITYVLNVNVGDLINQYDGSLMRCGYERWCWLQTCKA